MKEVSQHLSRTRPNKYTEAAGKTYPDRELVPVSPSTVTHSRLS